MQAVKDDASYDLVNPATGAVSDSLPARQVFEEIIDRAWHTGEPGVLFIDAANRDNATQN